MGVFKKVSFILSKSQKIKMLLLLVLILIGTFFEWLSISIILPFINLISNPDLFMKEDLVKIVCDLLNIKSIKAALIVCIAAISGIYLVKNILLIITYKIQYRFIYNSQRKLSVKLLESYLNRPYMFFINKNSSELLRSIDVDVSGVYQFILSTLQLITEGFVCLVLFFYLLSLDIYVIGMVGLLMFLSLLVSYRFYKVRITKSGQINRTSYAKMIQWAQQSFGGIKEIKILEKEQYFLQKYNEVATQWADSKGMFAFLSILPRPVIETVSICCFMLCIMIKILQGAEMSYFLPIMSAFVVAAFRLLPSFNRIMAYINSLLYYKPSVEALYNDLLEMRNDERKEIFLSTDIAFTFEKAIKINDICFRYPEDKVDILHNINFQIFKNKSVAFIGSSGSGKSTLINIILRLLEPQSGEIDADDINVNNDIHKWHKMMGYIPQFIYLIDATIRENVALGIEEKEINDDRVWEVLKMVRLESFVKRLDNKIYTEIGEQGVRLSGGQRQRIGLARALYNNPEILILDEATSSLDVETEKAVMETIDNLRGNKTMIIVAHRLATIRDCDYIYEINDGKAVLMSRDSIDKQI